ncbi:hypothetical protein ACWIBQ_01840 [Microbacterium keratanolyticum]
MSEPALAPRNALGGMAIVWIVGAVAAVTIGLFVPEPLVMPWMVIAFGGCLLLSFGVQLVYGRTQGFIVRVAGSALGALLLMGLSSVGFALATILHV